MAGKKIKIDFKKYKKQSQEREQKLVRCSILIVCEGAKTEPNYFRKLARNRLGIIVYDIEVQGFGRNTIGIVEKAIDLKNKNNYDRVWAVFDKDDFPAKDFNDAIILGKSNGVEVAWSNEAFELWFLYHFQNVITGLSRRQYKKKISAAVNKSPQYKSKNKYVYTKNAQDNFEIMTTYGSMDESYTICRKNPPWVQRLALCQSESVHNSLSTCAWVVRSRQRVER
ncbi:MAG: RloB family protein [Prevotella sp.]|nr:RloB family protein [Prevotella sp.]